MDYKSSVYKNSDETHDRTLHVVWERGDYENANIRSRKIMNYFPVWSLWSGQKAARNQSPNPIYNPRVNHKQTWSSPHASTPQFHVYGTTAVDGVRNCIYTAGEDLPESIGKDRPLGLE
jgi:hypothetical protein